MLRAMRWNYVGWILLSALIVYIDQYTKGYAMEHLALQKPVVLNSFFNWYLDFNKGAAFSLFNSGMPWQRWILAGFSALVALIVLVLLKNSEENNNRTQCGLALILGGAVGNLIDRAVSGWVTDFIQWHVGSYYWPTFNFADSAVCIGVVFFLWGMR